MNAQGEAIRAFFQEHPNEGLILDPEKDQKQLMELWTDLCLRILRAQGLSDSEIAAWRALPQRMRERSSGIIRYDEFVDILTQ